MNLDSPLIIVLLVLNIQNFNSNKNLKAEEYLLKHPPNNSLFN